jgi:hypothetical protein
VVTSTDVEGTTIALDASTLTLASTDPDAVHAHVRRIAEMEPAMVRAISAAVDTERDSLTGAWLAAFIKHRVYMGLTPRFASYADWIRARFAPEIAALAKARKRDAAWAEKRIRQALDYRASLHRNGTANRQLTASNPVDAFVSRVIKTFAALTLDEQQAVLVKMQALYRTAVEAAQNAGAAAPSGTKTDGARGTMRQRTAMVRTARTAEAPIGAVAA